MTKELELNEVDTDRLKLLLKIANYHADTSAGKREMTGETIVFLQRLRKDLKDIKRVNIVMLEQ